MTLSPILSFGMESVNLEIFLNYFNLSLFLSAVLLKQTLSSELCMLICFIYFSLYLG